MNFRGWVRKHHQRIRRLAAEERRRARQQSRRRFETLEPRLVLDGLGTADYTQVSSAWFSTVPQIYTGTDAISVSSLTAGTGDDQTDTGWPRWIVRVREADAGPTGSPRGAEQLLDQGTVDFQVIRGLGLPGQVLVRAFASGAESRAALAASPHVAAFEADGVVAAQVLPNDPDFPSMTNLHNVGQFGAAPDADIDAPEAWDMNTGSSDVVVGVIDSGIDVTHPDLYLNIWINQGEIPAEFKTELDADADGRITFYDLNDPGNAAYVKDFNGNTYIDAQDLLEDPRWADGLDTDENGFVDDFYGWNFRTASDEPFAPNDPRDALGHGTHVAGTIGAIGNNGRGVTGINWRSSLMALKFLDDANQGQTSDAVLAINYATMMRTQEGENVRVLNASWGQSGGGSPALRTAIDAAGQAGMLFVAAAGNGNILGQGINIDREPFYPASYDLNNIISVAATDSEDRLARFSNFGAASVDLAAPGIGVVSTLPGRRYGTANGTSMAAPHVTGVAALIWSDFPDATPAEVRQGVLDSVDAPADLQGRLKASGRLNALKALQSDDFAPRALLVGAANVTTAGGIGNTVVVRYTDRQQLDLGSLGDGDLLITHLWGPDEPLSVSLERVDVREGGCVVEAEYQVAAPDGSWDVFDFGEYRISLKPDEITNVKGLAAARADLGSFHVRIGDDPSVIYVDVFYDAADFDVGDGISDDGTGHSTLRSAVQEANATDSPRTIILDPGRYTLSLRDAPEDAAASGDLDITGQISILGDEASSTIVDAALIDRVFEVRPDASLDLKRVTVTGGLSGTSSEGGGILSRGDLTVSNSTIAENNAGYGGGLYVADGTSSITATLIADNRSSAWTGNSGIGGGGGIYAGGGTVLVNGSTIAENSAQGGGAGISVSGGALVLANSTISRNRASGDGAAVLVAQSSTSSATLTYVTVAENVSAHAAVYGPAEVSNSIMLANETSGGYWGANDAFGVHSGGYNLVGIGWPTTFNGPGDQIVRNASQFLGPLQDNGGPTWTHALLPSSPAIDAADPLAYPATDQRGIPRSQDGNGDGGNEPDIGAFESFGAEVHGVVFEDLDGDREQDPNEKGLAGRTVYMDLNGNGAYDREEPTAATQRDDPDTFNVVEGGGYSFAGLEPGLYHVAQLLPEGWRQTAAGFDIKRLSVGYTGQEANGSSGSPSISADGRFVAFISSASNLVPGHADQTSDVFVYDRRSDTIEVIADGGYTVSLSSDGRFVAFDYNFALVPEDTNGQDDVFVYDLQTGVIERVSVADNGQQGNGESGGFNPLSISANGDFVAFSSWASNLVPGDTNQASDVFVYDRQSDRIERVSVPDATFPELGDEANEDSFAFSLSADGRFVAFLSDASNLVPGDTNHATDIFVYDRQNDTTERVSVPDRSVPELGHEANEWSGFPSLSADGRFVAFASHASNLVPGDTNGAADIFVYDRQNGAIERVSVPDDSLTELGQEANASSESPSLSADGRFVAFASRASNLTPGDTNQAEDIFVYDRQADAIEQVTTASGGAGTEFWGLAISGDGRLVAFDSNDPSLVEADYNHDRDVFVSPTFASRASTSFTAELFAGRVLDGVNFGSQPLPGEIHGQLFEDLIPNGAKDAGEPGLEGWKVYLDSNHNARPDPGEMETVTDRDGNYAFVGLRTETSYTVASELRDGWVQTLPSADDTGIWHVFLPAGQTIRDRDFGLRPVQTVGQFENAVVTGRLFTDRNGNGRQDADEPGLAGVTLFLDLNDDGVRQFNEPRTISAGDDPQTPADENGQYSFQHLGSRSYSVRSLDVLQSLQTAPVGNALSRQAYSLAVPGKPAGGPQDVAVVDVNGDGWPDLASAIFDGNSLALLVNDQHGGFAQPMIEIPLAPADRPVNEPRGLGPIAVLAGDFNGQGGMDLAVANSLSSNVTILLDFDGERFVGEQYVNVGALPNSIARADFDGDYDLDLVVTNEWSNTVSILRNDGQGRFAPVAAPAVGNHPFGVAAGDFNEDGRMDLAVANFGTHPRGGDLGDVRVLLANQAGSFQSAIACPVGLGPSAIVTADLDGDGHLDLAVTNFLSDNVTVCRGLGNGTFTSVATLPGGSGPMDIDAADLDGDNDVDLLVTSGKSKKVGILRNRLSQGTFEFEPAESFGVANFPGASQISLATGDVDGNGTVDLVLASSQENSVAVHLNTLVGGAHRLALTGVETVTGVDFAFQAVNLAPTLDAIADRALIAEDAGVQWLLLTGISAGGDLDPQPIAVSATSGDLGLLNVLGVEYTSGDTTALLRYVSVLDQSGSTVVTVTVTDGGLDGDPATSEDNGSVVRSFRVTVLPVNDPPLANYDRVATLEDTAVDIAWSDLLDNDSDVDTPLEAWRVASVGDAVDGVAVNDAANRQIRFTPTAGFRGLASFVYTLTDGMGGSDSAMVMVGVAVANQPPTDITLSQTSIAENTDTAIPWTVGTLGAEDPDAGDVHVYSLVAGQGDADNRLFVIAGQDLQIKAGVALDHEAQAAHSVRLQAFDGAAATQKAFTIAVTDVNEYDPVVETQTLSVPERAVFGTSVGLLTAHDGDTTQTLRFAIVGGNEGGAFAIPPGTEEIVVVDGGQLDFESQRTYTLTVSATDNGQPPRSGSGTVIVQLEDVNEAPIFLAVRERVEGEWVGELPVRDPDGNQDLTFAVLNDHRFQVVDFQLKLNAGESLLRSAAGQLELDIRATDSGQPPLSHTQTFVVQVLANDHPWQNPLSACDVDRSNGVTPGDALALINEINRGRNPNLASIRPVGEWFLDPTGDDTITPADVLAVVNWLNSLAASAEGEAGTFRADVRGTPVSVAASTASLIADDPANDGRNIGSGITGSLQLAPTNRPLPGGKREPAAVRQEDLGWDELWDWEETLSVLAAERLVRSSSSVTGRHSCRA